MIRKTTQNKHTFILFFLFYFLLYEQTLQISGNLKAANMYGRNFKTE